MALNSAIAIPSIAFLAILTPECLFLLSRLPDRPIISRVELLQPKLYCGAQFIIQTGDWGAR
jgi:hypothetical protein